MLSDETFLSPPFDWHRLDAGLSRKMPRRGDSSFTPASSSSGRDDSGEVPASKFAVLSRSTDLRSVSLANSWDEKIVETVLQVVAVDRGPSPCGPQPSSTSAGQLSTMACRLRSGCEADLGVRKPSSTSDPNLVGRRVEGRDVVDGRAQLFCRRPGQLDQCVNCVLHDHEGNPGVRPNEARVGFTLAPRRGSFPVRSPRCLPDGTVTAEISPGNLIARKSTLPDRGFGGQLFVVLSVVASEVFTVELVAAVHRRRVVPFLFPNCPRSLLGLQIRQAIGRD